MDKENKLLSNSLGLAESVIMGTAGAAPAFSVSAATVTLILAVNTLAPASILYSGIIMFGITLAFIHLNKIVVNAGASYAWVSLIFGSKLGFFAGWSLLVCSAIFMVAGCIPAATTTLLLFSPDLANSPVWVSFIGALWLSLVSCVALRGIKHSSYLQILLTSLELCILVSIIVAGFWYFSAHAAHSFSFSWFALNQFTPGIFAKGALVAVFLFWGWDVTLNLNEETRKSRSAAGLGAFWSVIIIILLFVSFSVIVLLALSDSEIKQSGTNILFNVADKLFPRPWGYLAILSVILSSVGTLETSILQFTRTLFAQGRDKTLNPRYARLHPSWKTPSIALYFIWGIGMFFLFLASFYTTITDLIQDSVNAIGFQVAFYYSLTGFACAWYYRFLWKNLYELITYVIWPAFSAIFLIFIVGISLPTFDTITLVIGLGGILSGFIPYFLNKKQAV